MPEIKPLMRKEELVIQKIGDELLVYDLVANKAFALNSSSRLIWELCTGDKTIPDIAKSAAGKLGASVNEEFVWLALDRLNKENLLETGTGLFKFHPDISRRETIKRAGLVSMVALPTVFSLVAPRVVDAQSAGCSVTPFALGCTCGNSGSCASNCCNFFAPGQTGSCVPAGNVALGGACVRSCQCANNTSVLCGASLTCIPFNSVPVGSPCRFSNECVPGASCTGIAPSPPVCT